MFVGNLSFDVTREELIEAFSAAGRVLDAKVPVDRETGRPRGFAFVEFESEDAVQRAVAQMTGVPLKGRPLRVSEAEDRPPRAPGAAPAGPRPGPRPGGFRSDTPSFRPGGPPATSEPLFGEREGRRREFGGGKPPNRKTSFVKEKGPRRVEKRKKNNDFEDDDYY